MLENVYKILLEEAKIGYAEDEVPISAVIVKNDEIISYAHNLKESLQSVMAHAEILAIEKASEKLNNWRLDGCDIYISLEPCTMCISAIHQARIKNVYYFTKRKDMENFHLISQIAVEKNSNSSTQLHYLYYGDELTNLLQDFFKNRR